MEGKETNIMQKAVNSCLICATTNKNCLTEDAFVSCLFVQNPTFLGGISACNLVMVILPSFSPGC